MIAKNLSKTLRCVGSPRGALFPRVAFGEVIYKPGGRYGPKVQEYFQLFAVIEGSVNIEFIQGSFTIEEGQVALLRPHQRELQKFSPHRKTHHVWCSLHPTLLDPGLRDVCLAASNVLPTPRHLMQLIERGLSLPQGETPRAQSLHEAVALNALNEYLFTDERKLREEHEPPGALRNALEWIELKCKGPMDLDSLAREAGVSPGYLGKLFKIHLDTTPIRYLWKARTRAAVQLLRETSLPISQIAYDCGFQTVPHFTRLLRQHYGMSPRQLRAQTWKNGNCSIYQ